jgi:hypothetical protein
MSSGIIRKDGKVPVRPGDVLTVTHQGQGVPLRIKVGFVRDGRVWGWECGGMDEAFGPLLAFRPENVGCEVSTSDERQPSASPGRPIQ